MFEHVEQSCENIAYVINLNLDFKLQAVILKYGPTT